MRISLAVYWLPVCVAALGAPAPAKAQIAPIPGFTLGATLQRASVEQPFLQLLDESAAFESDLFFFLSLAGSGPELPGTYLGLRTNTSIPISESAHVTGSNMLPLGGEVVFGICTNVTGLQPDPLCRDRRRYFTGPAERNPDGLVHAVAWTREMFLQGCATFQAQHGFVAPGCSDRSLAVLASDPRFTVIVGFEDLFGEPHPPDYDDVLFAVSWVTIAPQATVVPEPLTITLLASGLAGIGAARASQRRAGTTKGTKSTSAD